MFNAEQTRTWHVLVVDDRNGRRAIALDAVTFSLGRDPSNSIVLDSTAISRQHAILLRVPNADGTIIYRILDGNSEGKPSLNGIMVNGRKCLAKDLADGDEILFGGKVKAQYCVRQLTEEQYNQYIQSVSYRSVKSGVSDPRITIAEQLEQKPQPQDAQKPAKLVKRQNQVAHANAPVKRSNNDSSKIDPAKVENKLEKDPTTSIVLRQEQSISLVSRLVNWFQRLFAKH